VEVGRLNFSTSILVFRRKGTGDSVPDLSSVSTLHYTILSRLLDSEPLDKVVSSIEELE
jgi:hypothetical protein